MALPGMAASRPKSKARPLAPVLETDHEAVAPDSNSSTALVVSTKGTLDDDDDDFFR